MKWIKDNFWIVVIIFGCFLITVIPIVDIYLALNGYIIPSILSWGCCMIGVLIIYLGALLGISSKVLF